MHDILFVYGTLKSNQNNDFAVLLRNNSIYLGDGFINGKLYETKSYPVAIINDVNNSFVHGELYKVIDSERILNILDDYEGNEFTRVIIDARKDSKILVKAWIYLYNENVTDLYYNDTGIYQ